MHSPSDQESSGSAVAVAPDGQRIYRCGSLSYTPRQLYSLLFWLLVGAMSIGLANTVPSSILPVQVKGMPLSDTSRWILLGGISTILNMTVCPYISVASDLYRSKWGRRIPFIVVSMPPVVLGLVLFAFTHKFGGLLSEWAQPFWETSPATMTAVVMGLAMFIFQFFMMWVNSVIWYIFIDIIPPEYFSKTLAIMRLGLQLSAAIFSYFLFPLAEAHAGAIFIGVAVFYGVGVSLMCIFVKEGIYPPLTEEQLARKNARGIDLLMSKLRGFKEFFSYTFCHRIYVYRYLVGVLASVSGAGSAFFYFLHSLQFNLNDTYIGRMNGICGVIYAGGIFVAIAVAGLVNRWHPTRIITYNTVFSMIVNTPFLLRWVFGTLEPSVFVNFTIINAGIYLFLNGLVTISEQPMEMFLFPKSRFGTFCAMQAMLRSWSALICGFLGARALDFASAHFSDTSFALTFGADSWHYRLIEPWMIPWSFLIAFVGYKVYRHWRKLGGYEGYAAPAPWVEGGYEHVDRLKVHTVNPRFFTRMLVVFDIIIATLVVLTPLFALWRCRWSNDAPRVLAEVPETCTVANIIHDFLFTGAEPELLREFLAQPTIIAVAAACLWIAIRLRLQFKAMTAKDGRGLFQPALMLIFVGILALDWFNCVLATWQTEGVYGAKLMTINSLAILMAVLSIGIIAFMERDTPPIRGEDTGKGVQSA